MRPAVMSQPSSANVHDARTATDAGTAVAALTRAFLLPLVREAVRLELAERAETEPKVFTRIHFHFRVSGKALKPEAVARAIELSKEKYCSASIMLGKTAEITHDFEIIET